MEPNRGASGCRPYRINHKYDVEKLLLHANHPSNARTVSDVTPVPSSIAKRKYLDLQCMALTDAPTLASWLLLLVKNAAVTTARVAM